MKSTRTFAMLGAALLAAAAVTACAASETPLTPTPTPQGFDKYLVYMGAGAYDPGDPSYTPPSGEYFQEVIMGRSEAEIRRERAEALAFFEERFGIDPLESKGRVVFESFMLDPRNDYRAYTISGENVPSEGWVVRDGGWRVEVVHPGGVELGGEFSGEVVPQGTSMVFGDYNIRVSKSVDEDAFDPDAIVIHYESGHPIVRDDQGNLMFLCDLESELYGAGVAQGISAPQTTATGLRQTNIRNVLTFPKYGPSRVFK